MNLLDAIVAAFLILAVTCGGLWFLGVLAKLICGRAKPLPEPDDPRLRNVVSIRDWKHKRDRVERYG